MTRKKKQDFVILENHTMSREELEIAYMAAELKIAFKDKWQSVHGKKYVKIDRADNQKYWMEAARQVVAVNGTADTYIEAQFTMSKSICLPRNLAGPKALQKYKSYLISKGMNDPVLSKAMVDSSGRIDPGKAEVRELLAAHASFISGSYGIQNIGSEAHAGVVLAAPWLFEPLATCLLLWKNQSVLATFREGALERLNLYPYLERAIQEMGYEEELTAIKKTE